MTQSPQNPPAPEPENTPAPLVIKTSDFLKSATAPEHFPPDEMPQVAFVGRSNVGKSTLLNCLVQRKNLARVSNTPGRTREINFFTVNGTFYLVDLPGYGYAKISASEKRHWDRMITGYLADNPRLRGIVCLFDIRRDEATAEDETLVGWINRHDIPWIAVLTKADKLAFAARQKSAARWRAYLTSRGAEAVVPFSSMTRVGRDELLVAVAKLLE